MLETDNFWVLTAEKFANECNPNYPERLRLALSDINRSLSKGFISKSEHIPLEKRVFDSVNTFANKCTCFRKGMLG